MCLLLNTSGTSGHENSWPYLPFEDLVYLYPTPYWLNMYIFKTEIAKPHHLHTNTNLLHHPIIYPSALLNIVGCYKLRYKILSTNIRICSPEILQTNLFNLSLARWSKRMPHFIVLKVADKTQEKQQNKPAILRLCKFSRRRLLVYMGMHTKRFLFKAI